MSRVLSFPLHSRVSDLQQEHGLQRRDYHAYRTYCTRRIRRLRHHCRLPHINGVKRNRTQFSYTRVTRGDLSAQTLEIVLLEAERAWAYGHQLKQEYHDLNEENSHLRIHYLSRFRKAMRKASELESLCTGSPQETTTTSTTTSSSSSKSSSLVTVDELTRLESEVYSLFIRGVYHLENEQWLMSRKDLLLCSTIYKTLVESSFEVVGGSVRELFRRREREVRDLVELCSYWMQQEGIEIEEDEKEGEGGQSSQENHGAGAGADGIDDGSGSGGLELRVMRIFMQKRKKAGETIENVSFLGVQIPVETDRFRDLYESAMQVQKEIADAKDQNQIETQLDLYDRLLTTYRDARVSLRDDLKKFSFREESFRQNLNRLHAYMDFQEKMQTIERNRVLIRSYEIQIAKAESGQLHRGRRAPKREDVVRLFELILQNIEDAKELPLVCDNDEMLARLSGKAEMFATLKCFALSKAYAAKFRFRECFGLLLRAAERFEEAKKLIVDTEDQTFLATFMEENLEKEKALATARSFLAENEEPESQQSVESARLRAAGRISLLEDLDTYREVKKRNPFLVHFPPNYQPVPPKPLYFDVAGNMMPGYPDLSKRLQGKKKKGWFW